MGSSEGAACARVFLYSKARAGPFSCTHGHVGKACVQPTP